LTGPNAAGKGEVAGYLQERGFTVHSLSDIVREEATRRGLPTDRGHLIQVGNLLRRLEGPGALAERLLPRLGQRDVVDSIRTPAEVEVLRRLTHFILLGIRASVATRFQRSLVRSRPGDPRTLEEFCQREREENSTEPEAQQLEATFRLADRVLDNDGDRATLRGALDRDLDDWSRRAAG
jgi:dephospho-CoA kinase